MKTKEFMVRKLASKDDALSELCRLVTEYPRLPDKWQWHTKPEVLHGPDGYRAYCRIQWEA